MAAKVFKLKIPSLSSGLKAHGFVETSSSTSLSQEEEVEEEQRIISILKQLQKGSSMLYNPFHKITLLTVYNILINGLFST